MSNKQNPRRLRQKKRTEDRKDKKRPPSRSLEIFIADQTKARDEKKKAKEQDWRWEKSRAARTRRTTASFGLYYSRRRRKMKKWKAQTSDCKRCGRKFAYKAHLMECQWCGKPRYDF